MPRTLREPVPRKNIRIPKPMMDEVEKIAVDHPELYNNRQQFIESAIREKIEGVRLMEQTMSQEIGDDLSGPIKEVLLAHAIINTVKEKRPPAHLDLKWLEQSVRRYLMKRAEREGKKLKEKRLDELTRGLLEYHQAIMEGLTFIGHE